MDQPRKSESVQLVVEAKDGSRTESHPATNPSRRVFLGTLGKGVGVTVAAGALGVAPVLGKANPPAASQKAAGAWYDPRAEKSFELRRIAAAREREIPVPPHGNNGDEAAYANKIGNYSKGLPHNTIGEVDPTAYESFLRALSTGQDADFENIVIGGNVGLVDPQAGLAFDLEGTDCHQLGLEPPPPLASAERAGEAVECYWMSLLRDVNFSQYSTNPTALAACAELSRLSDFRGPKVSGKVVPQTLFRGVTSDDVLGPYVSQFLLKTIDFGAMTMTQKFNTYLPGTDYLTNAPAWLAVQNGNPPSERNSVDPTPRHVRNGRDLSAFVHVDVLYQAYFHACLWLLDNGAPLNPGNPYGSSYLVSKSRTQVGFGTFGGPHIVSLLAEVCTRALKVVWFQKWFVHRTLRPEEFGGRVHFTKLGASDGFLHSDVLNSQAVAEVFRRNGTYFLPHAFPEGCPQHPSYGQGHGTVAGACVTILKAFFDDSFRLSEITDVVQSSNDGLSLVPYNGLDRDLLTVGGELHKVAANIGIGRNHAAVHWRSDYANSLTLGEAVAISVLRDQRDTYNEAFQGFTFQKFDGTSITV